MSILSSCSAAAAAASTIARASGARAQVWPDQPLKVVVPVTAGGLSDTALRVVDPNLPAGQSSRNFGSFVKTEFARLGELVPHARATADQVDRLSSATHKKGHLVNLNPFRRKATLLALMTVALSAAPVAWADIYPGKTVKIVVPYTPGGTNDLVARLVAQKLTESMGQTFIVENKPGASGNLGAEQVARSAADGYTLLLVTTGHSIAPSLYTNLRYSIKTDLTPVSGLTSGPLLVMTNPKAPYKTIGELIAAAKAKPASINFGSAGNGSSTHLAVEQLNSIAGVKMTHIPYSGSMPAMQDVMAGNAQLVMDLMFSAIPQVVGGKLSAIAITGTKRSPLLPDVPTVAESGVPGFDVEVWNGLMAPAGTPRPVIDKLNAEIRKAMESADMKKRLEAQGFEAATGTPEKFGALIASETTRWAKVVQSSGAKVE